MTSTPILTVEDLRISFGAVNALNGLSLELEPGRALGLVGESGSGKSAAALSLLGLHRGTGAQVGGRILLHPRPTGAGEIAEPVDINTADDETLRRIRGRELAMIFQEPLTSLDPYHRVGDQIAGVHRLHFRSGPDEARARAAQALEQVGIDARSKYRAYPHEFSGGMRQRALIAMALVLEPRVLVADEPTTALDVTVQAQILQLLGRLREEIGLSLILISHDLAVVGGNVDDVLVLKSGDEVERGPVREVLTRPQHAYTKDLLNAIPRLDAELPTRIAASAEPLLKVTDLSVVFPSHRGSAATTAVDGVSLELLNGESLGVVGESGSGKSTLGRSIVRLQKPTSGRIEFAGRDLGSWRGKALRDHRRDLQLIFQDPASSLNPRRSIGDSIAEPLIVHGEKDRDRLRAAVDGMLERVGLDDSLYHRYPHQLSGGQRQRAAIARALILRPRLVVCDEPVSALDVTTQAQVVKLLRELREEFELTLVFIAHDLAVVRQVSDRIAVMNRGRIVELLPAAGLHEAQDPYTRALLSAVPELPVA
ncbi:ABC transporter ATP-binding protein [Actinospica sp. MGRD01-02]|uniref:ABC transporter ATP-binding protein n=1 Tax=Actinospica acidithermotolerans TaxID=2828514 RepID=A0A941EI35_9ACTN|nr:ABC transporter ATP-binding protein [Actinospica acidithermotolerans]MBR7829509.1 ABC transporter ATP-binding protein [Actinospica acidithermotolerans]